MRGTNAKHEKNRPKRYILRTVVMRLKSWDPQKAHLRPSPSPHTNFQPPSSVCGSNRQETAHFHGQEGDPPSYLPS